MTEPHQGRPRLSRAVTQIRKSVFATLHATVARFEQAGGDLIPLHIGDTHLAPPAAVSAVPIDSEALSIYGPVAGTAALRQQLALLMRKRGHGGVGEQHIHVGCGATHALFCAARALLDEGDEVLVMTPCWPLISGVLRTCGVVPVEVPLTQQLYREPDLDIGKCLEAARSPRTRGIYLITPNNPDGQVYSLQQLKQIAEFAKEHDYWVFADEVYSDFVYEGQHHFMGLLEGMAQRTVSAYSLSKSHGLAGARIGYVVASEQVIEATRRISNHTVYNVPVSMQAVALAALEGGDGWLEAARARYLRARDETAAALAAIGLSCPAPRGGSFFFIDMSQRLEGRPLQALLERGIAEGVLLAPGEAFGACSAQALRLCFTGAAEERVVQGVQRFGRALDALA